MTRLLLLLLAAAIVAGLASLGFWQLDRARVKQHAIDQQSERTSAAPLTSAALTVADVEALRFRRARITGRYDTTRQFLLDNRTRDGVAGYEVYTPFLTDDADNAVLVNRGWIPVGPRRTVLPDVSVPESHTEVAGTVEVPRSATFLLGEAGYEVSGWPRVVQRIEPVRIASLLAQPVAPVAVRLAADLDHGFVRQWTPHLGIPPARHNAYAFQWFALAATLVIIVAVLLRKALRPGGSAQ